MNTMIKGVYAQPRGTYDHYFVEFLSPTDVAVLDLKSSYLLRRGDDNPLLLRLLRVGRSSRCGPGVRRAVRVSLVAIMVLDFTLTVTLWGLEPTFVFKG